MAPPTPPRAEAGSGPARDEQEDAPVSIASLRSKFESMSAGNAGPSQKPLSTIRPKAPVTASRPSEPAKGVAGERPEVTQSEVMPDPPSDVEKTKAVSRPDIFLQGEAPKAPTSEAVQTRRSSAAVDPHVNQRGQAISKEGVDDLEAPVSVKAMKERFAGGPMAGLSKPKPVVPPKSAALSSRSSTLASQKMETPSIQRISADGLIGGPESPTMEDKSTLLATTAVTDSLHVDDSAQSLISSPTTLPVSRPVSPRPPEPSRSTKPTLRSSPSPQPTPQRSRTSSVTTLNDLMEPSPAAARQPPPPKLPVRKATLPPSASLPIPDAPIIAVDLITPPLIPGNKPRPAPSLGSINAAETPRLPERPRSQTVSKSEPSLPPRPPQRQSTVDTVNIASGSYVPRIPTRSSNGGSIRRVARAAPASNTRSIPMSGEEETPYEPPPPPTRAPLGSTPPRRSGSGTAGTSTADADGDETGDDEDDEDEGGTAPVITTQAQRMLEDYPDSTNANRRPPSFVPDIKIQPTNQIYAFAVHGRYVCTAAHHVKVYDTIMSNQPILVVDLKDTGLEFRIKEPRVSAMCFRPAAKLADEGRYLWCGTKDGHLWELDIRTGEVTDTKQGVHGSPVVNIIRYRQFLLTLEENGKLHVFEVSRETDSPMTLLRTVRVSDRFTFAQMVGGKLWTATAPPNRSTTNTTSKGPTIRVYEPCAEGSMPAAKTLYATEWTGAVTSATMIPFRPTEVYLAHEGGYMSVWDADDCSCLQVLKIGASDILAVEGVGERLWTGNRKGQIHVYDISERPWKTTNLWTAHHEQAIQDLYIDFRAIEDTGRFALWSCTKETLRAWDGLLSVDWIDHSMSTRQDEYCTFRSVTAMVCSWNIDSAKPGDLVGENAQFLPECLNSVDQPDIIVFGFQEVIPLTDKKLTAKTLLFGAGKRDTGTGDKVTMAYRHWVDKLTQALRSAVPGTTYQKVHSDNLVGLMTCIFVKSSERENLRGLDITSVKRGIGGIYGNKGALVARMVIDDTSLCFINVHLAAGQSQKAARNADLAGIMEDKAIFPEHDLLPFVQGGDGTGIMDHEMVILNGDLNYRIDQRRENVMSNVAAGELDYLLEHDQLRKEMKTNHAFRLRSFEEAPITFAPTYKYNRGTNDYDSSEKRRIPAWCDRVVYRKCPNIECIDYRRYETTASDHKPVSAGFQIKVKAIDKLLMQEVKQEARADWAKQEAVLLERIMKALPDIL